jgi:hypothetical protein
VAAPCARLQLLRGPVRSSNSGRPFNAIVRRHPISMESVNREELLISLLTEDLKTYRALENWGATLFLTAIAIVAKQVFDWDQVPGPIKFVVPASVASVPAIVGLAAFAFLRIINYRTSRTWKTLYQLALPRDKGTSAGWLGWFIASMPLALGLLVTGILNTNQSRAAWFDIILITAAFIVVYSVYWHIRARRKTDGA